MAKTKPPKQKQQNWIPFPPLSSFDFENVNITQKEADALHKKIEFMNVVVLGVVVILLIGFATVFATLIGILTDTWRYNINSYIDYQESAKHIEINNTKIQGLEQQVKILNDQIPLFNKQQEEPE